MQRGAGAGAGPRHGQRPQRERHAVARSPPARHSAVGEVVVVHRQLAELAVGILHAVRLNIKTSSAGPLLESSPPTPSCPVVSCRVLSCPVVSCRSLHRYELQYQQLQSPQDAPWDECWVAVARCVCVPR
jgi:hypothetical protein